MSSNVEESNFILVIVDEREYRLRICTKVNVILCTPLILRLIHNKSSI